MWSSERQERPLLKLNQATALAFDRQSICLQFRCVLNHGTPQLP